MIENLEGEIWKDIPEWEGLYQVSNLGRVKSMHKKIKNLKGNSFRNTTEQLLSMCEQTRGYLMVFFWLNGKRKSATVHRIVMLAFVGRSHLQVDHINGNKTDNRLENLRYCTNRENQMYYSESINKSSIYFGVSFVKKSKKWRARIRINGMREDLGEFSLELDAHYAYRDRLKAHLESITPLH